jgi:23S rRNA (cytidine1920-2'-O)/16S rRNA (cytidine1409-2'-O)-methyltransferase
MAGAVYAGGERIPKPDRLLDEETALEVRTNAIPYVGYGGVKLEKAIKEFGIDPRGKTVVDIGSSTGGFVDFMLQAGALKVYAVDAGTHQLHEKLRQDKRVILFENTNARSLAPERIGEKADIVTIDVSFISLKKILPAARALLTPGGKIVSLVKPQFEVGRYQVGKGGIVKDEERIRAVLDDIREFGRELGLVASGQVEAPRERDRKNREYFILWEQ